MQKNNISTFRSVSLGDYLNDSLMMLKTETYLVLRLTNKIKDVK